MRIYIDSADIGEIREAMAMGFVYGVTTNPTILRRANLKKADVPALVREAVESGARELHLQTYSRNTARIVEEGRQLAALDPARVVVKIPATQAGYAAAAKLTSDDMRVTLTAVYTVRQAVLADALGASYIAVYLGRMRDQGLDALEIVGQMQRVIEGQRSRMEILSASVREPGEVEDLARLGVATATLPMKVLRRLQESPATDAAAEAFLQDAEEIR
jgi:transaldolase